MGGSGLKLNDESISFLKITSPKPSIIFDMVIRHSYSEQALCVNSIDQRQGAIASNRKVSLCIQFFFFFSFPTGELGCSYSSFHLTCILYRLS